MIEETVIADPAQTAVFDAELRRIVEALGVKPTNGSSLIALRMSTGEQYALADIVEALVVMIGTAVR